MALGWMEEGVCYSVQQYAIDHHFQTISPTILTTTTTQTVVMFVRQASGVWNIQHFTQSATGAVTQQYSVAVTNPIFGSCTLPNDPSANFAQGVELGWAVSGVMVIAFCLRFLRRR